MPAPIPEHLPGQKPLAEAFGLGYVKFRAFIVPAVTSPRLRFIPLGGLGEIGANCFALEQDDGILVVDCGTSFPQNDIGIDVVHPDFSWLKHNRHRISGLFLTHAHEDHIGAVPYFLRDIDVPIWGPVHALELVKHRLAEHEIRESEVDLRPAPSGAAYTVGPFTVEPVRVAHSIVEASALCIETCAGTVVHTGDFNLDPEPPDGEPTDVERLKAIGARGVRLLFSDSTNIDVPERPGSERAVGGTLHGLIAEAPKCVVVAMFASNVQRLLMLGKIAQATGRKLCLLGRSLGVHVDIARRIGRLDWPSNLLIGPEHIESQRRDKVLVLAGGTQGEGASAMRRLASQTHQHLRLEPGDTVIHSARVIPGNERLVHEMFCDLLRQGVQLHTRHTHPGVHTSGHAGRSEQAQMIEWLKPRAFVPVHGTLHHLRQHAALARSLGVSETLVVENGTPVAVDAGGIRRDTAVAHGKVNIAYGGEVLEPETGKRRTDLGRYGVVVVSLVVSAGNRCVLGPKVEARGVPNLDQQPGACRTIEREIRACLADLGARSLEAVEAEVRRAARRSVLESTGLRPVLVVHLLSEQ